jgi:uncharacterized protein (TIGR02569 family)
VTTPPPERVLAAFGRRGSVAQPLGGGQGRAWSAADLVVKPVDDVVEAAWVADVLSELVEDGFRINRPVQSEAGEWVVEGWSAWEALAGEHDTSSRWTDVLEVGKRLNAALRGLTRPAFLDSRVHAWAVGDRVAWAEEAVVVIHEVLRPVVERLVAYVGPENSPSQVIHGDLTGNVLFAPGLAPGVIDFTPYWRPPGFCLAIVAVDALLWQGAPAGLLESMPDAGNRTSLLARAALYRLITSDRLAVTKREAVRENYLRSAVIDHERVLGLLDHGAS